MPKSKQQLTAAQKKHAAREQAKLAAKGARKCKRCGLYGVVEYDSPTDLCNHCTDMILIGAPEKHADDDAEFELVLDRLTSY